jgi:predicted ester cyclase
MALRWLLFLGLFIAGSSAGVSAQASEQENKEVVRYLFERVWNDSHFDGLSTVWSAETPFHFRGSAPIVGPEGVVAQVRRWKAAFPDFRFRVEDIVAEGDKVAARVSFSGTHSGPFLGIEPTGRRIEVTEMMFFRFDDGIVVEVWEDYDEHGLRQQLAGDAF